MADAVKVRTEVAKMDVLSTGKMVIKENRLDMTVDYDVAYPYYSGYPMGLYQPAQNQYQPMMNQPMMNQPQSQPPQNQQANGGIIWVQGEEGAKAYLVAHGESRLLLDSEGNHFYLKSTDIQGMPQPLRVFDYVERTGQRQPAQAASVQAEEYVTRQEFNALAARLDALAAPKQAAKKPVKEEPDNG